MHDRIQRYVIPATVVIMSSLITVWLGADAASTKFLWERLLQASNASIVGAVITVGVTNFGLGYVCHALFCAVMFFRRKERLIEPSRLREAFGIPNTGTKLTTVQLDALLGEFHFRFHSRAPESLLHHCTRRNSAWYITTKLGLN